NAARSEAPAGNRRLQGKRVRTRNRRAESQALGRYLQRTVSLASRGALALIRFEARPERFLIEELLRRLGAALLRIAQAQRIALGVEVVGRLRDVHVAHRADALLRVAQR